MRAVNHEGRAADSGEARPAIETATLTDAVAADRARRRYRRRSMAPIPVDERIGPLLVADELVLAYRRRARIDRDGPGDRADGHAAIEGDLYLTTSRLVLVADTVISFDLDDLRDALLASDRLLLVMGQGDGARVVVDRPCLFRVEMATARARRTSGAGARAWPRPDPRSGSKAGRPQP